jgi:hypothetical protein
MPKIKRFKLTLTTIDGEVLDCFEVALAGSKAAMLDTCEETVGGFGSAGLCDRLKLDFLRYDERRKLTTVKVK